MSSFFFWSFSCQSFHFFSFLTWLILSITVSGVSYPRLEAGALGYGKRLVESVIFSSPLFRLYSVWASRSAFQRSLYSVFKNAMYSSSFGFGLTRFSIVISLSFEKSGGASKSEDMPPRLLTYSHLSPATMVSSDRIFSHFSSSASENRVVASGATGYTAVDLFTFLSLS